MSEEGDIGMYNLSRASESTPSTPRKPHRRTSVVSIFHGEEKTPIKSPSNPNLVGGSTGSPKSSRRVSRSNTLPRLQRAETGAPAADDFSALSMDPTKVTLLRRWVIALAVVDFDLDYGPKITAVFPPVGLTAAEEGNIAFLAFPDSPQAESGSYIHSFRLRHPASLSSLSTDGFVYGFSHFTQRRDSKSKRGYQQRSLVVLSQHPYPSLFYTIMSYLGQSFLSHGGPMLEVACHNIANWPDPQSSFTLELGFLGYVFTADLPHNADAQQSKRSRRQSVEKYGTDSHIVATLAPQHPPIIAALEACLSNLWSIWECLILCEPILVFGQSAAMTSQVVWWLRDLLRPIPLGGDFRPFFTIHDTDHAAFVNLRAPQAGLLIGVTNPIFARACNHWPHVLSLGSTRKNVVQQSMDVTVGISPGWTTKTHKRHISKDHILLKRLEAACHGDERAQLEASEALRDHLSAQTTAFLVPLQRYLNTLIPTHADRSTTPSPTPSHANFPSPGTPARLPAPPTPSTSALSLTVPMSAVPQLRLKHFHQDDFFASLKRNGSPLPFKSSAKRKEFYDKWLRTRAFGLWLAAQEEVVNRVLSEPPQSAVTAKSFRTPHSPAGSASS